MREGRASGREKTKRMRGRNGLVEARRGIRWKWTNEDGSNSEAEERERVDREG